MDALRYLDEKEPLGEAPSLVLVDLYRVKLAGRYKSPQHVAQGEVPNQGPDHVVRQARRRKPLHEEVTHNLRSAARQVPFRMSGCAWPFQWMNAREAMFSHPAAWVEGQFLPELKKEVNMKNFNDDDVVYVSYLESHAHYRLYGEHQEAHAKLKHLEQAVAANKKLAAAASRAGRAVPTIFSCIAAVNAVAFEWEETRISKPSAKRVDIVALCERGMKACQAAVDKYTGWLDVRRDQVEYAALRAYLLRADGPPQKDGPLQKTEKIMDVKQAEVALQDLDRALVTFCDVHEGAILADVLLLLRPNMEPAAQTMIKDSRVYRYLAGNLPGTKNVAEMMPAGNVPVRLTADMKQKIEEIASRAGGEG